MFVRLSSDVRRGKGHETSTAPPLSPFDASDRNKAEGRGEKRWRQKEKGLTVSPKWRAIFLNGMLRRDSDQWPDLAVLVLGGEDEGEGSWVAAVAVGDDVGADATEEMEEFVEVELGDPGSRGGCW